METLIRDFLDRNLRNAWLETSDIKLYVRKGHHLIDGKLCQTFDVASVEVVENKRSCGLFKSLMLYIESLGMPVYVESILNPSLAYMLEKHGYTLDVSRFNAYKVPQTD